MSQHLQHIIHRLNRHPRLALLLTIASAVFMAFLCLGQHPLHEWDESRYGLIAINMIERGDWINYYFADARDQIVSKPPLAIWSIAVSFLTFGYNEWALRLPSALAIIGSFVFIYRIIRHYRSPTTALFTCLMLMSVRGLIGTHVGRTGDTDAMLVFFLLGATYFFLSALDRNRKYHWCWMGLFWGGAFLAKGTPSLILVPGWGGYLLYRHPLRKVLRHSRIWWSVSIFGACVLFWLGLYYFLGKPYPGGGAAVQTPIERLLYFDTFQRFTEPGATYQNGPDYFFFFSYLDIRFNLWNYLGYLLLITWMAGRFWIRRQKWVWDRQKNLQVAAFLCWLPLTIFLTFATNKHHWYMAPVLPFIGINVTGLITYACRRWHWVVYFVLLLLAFTWCRRVVDLGTPGSYPSFLTRVKPRFQQAENVFFFRKPHHNYLLYLHFQNPDTKVLYKVRQVMELKTSSHFLITYRDQWEEQLKEEQVLRKRYRVMGGNSNYLILKTK